MSNNKKYIALPGGETCQLINPYAKEVATFDKHGKVDGGYINYDWADFEQNNPTYPLTEVMPEGETFDGVEVWQYRTNKDLVQAGVDKEIIWKIGNQELCKSLYADIPEATRIAIKPLKAIEPVRNNLFTHVCHNCDTKFDHEPNNLECSNCGASVDKSPPTDAVENKETVEDIIEKIINEAKALKINPGFGVSGIDIYDKFTNSFTFLSVHHLRKMLNDVAQYKQSQSIEGIVGFVLEWVASNVEVIWDREDILDPMADTDGILNMKSDIIKEYNNGK